MRLPRQNRRRRRKRKKTPEAAQKPRRFWLRARRRSQKLEKALKANANEINELIERGRPRGFVTDNEILYYFPKIEDNVGLLDEIYDLARKGGY